MVREEQAGVSYAVEQSRQTKGVIEEGVSRRRFLVNWESSFTKEVGMRDDFQWPVKEKGWEEVVMGSADKAVKKSAANGKY